MTSNSNYIGVPPNMLMNIVMADNQIDYEYEKETCVYPYCPFDTEKNSKHSDMCPKTLALELLKANGYVMHIYSVCGERKHKESDIWRAFSINNLVDFNEDRVEKYLKETMPFEYRKFEVNRIA